MNMKTADALLTLVVIPLFHGLVHEAAPVAGLNPYPAQSVTAPRSTAAREYLLSHNQARAAVGVGPLKWSEMLANATSRLVRYQRNKKNCQFAKLGGNKFGGNQLWASGAREPSAVVNYWAQDKEFYDYVSNSCAPNHDCGEYTQVVWRKSLELGCAQAVCDKSSLSICFYNPPGNYNGERPY
ncbi:hypothetical protein HS088_TW14G00223 [Tripterygium wilfordii]|uniref:SCP domain-containing protein n=1 Tax=Tripterygium wilfordii TaxID=458696 RepID=A0A7J7CQ47_TRIWF|nr:STS14 protein-like [Tripterygium wilfordii]KAF5736089.1 hypothetical protein HS088_TW14G00223 [Tripterygium wilfordii]